MMMDKTERESCPTGICRRKDGIICADYECDISSGVYTSSTTEAAPTGAMGDDEIAKAVRAAIAPFDMMSDSVRIEGAISEAIRLTRASDRAAMQALSDRLIHIAENAASIYDDEPSLSASDMMWGVARDIRAALDALKGVK